MSVVIDFKVVCLHQSSYSQLIFTELNENTTKIDFQNTLRELPQINVLTYQYFHNGGGVCIGDINNDGLPDLYFTSNLEPNRLYLNKGDMLFTDISSTAVVTGVTMIDINNDGFPDLYKLPLRAVI
ncbi:MAG: VCBS repeat-containing protein [Crocinitomicaceae bacterium]|nr:VCBS repeat-containing protein [Crocinitomicaceae bacterium]